MIPSLLPPPLLGMGPYLAYGPEYLNPALPSAVLNLQNFGTFSFDRPWNHNWNRMIPGWDIAINPFSRWRSSTILNRWNLPFRSGDVCLSEILLLHTKLRINRTIFRWDIAKIRRFSIWWPSAIYCCDVIVLYLCTLYYVPNIMLDFGLDWFSTFWYTWTSMFHHFVWKLSIRSQFLGFWGKQV